VECPRSNRARKHTLNLDLSGSIDMRKDVVPQERPQASFRTHCGMALIRRRLSMKKSAQQRGHSDHAWSKAVERCKYRECSGDPVMPGSIETEFPMHLANDHGAPSIGVRDRTTSETS